jgi:glutathione S-transferase
MNQSSTLAVYGSACSYFTGKLEGYLRYKEIPYRLLPMTADYFNRIVPENTGAQQMPAVELPDGRWMTDTTPMILWFEQAYPRFPILPADPVQAFLCRLIEDYADEWLWRPAMHYRWSYPHGRQFRGTYLVDELFTEVRLPAFLKRWWIRRRQKTHFVDGDGVTPATRHHVERGYLHLLDLLETTFRARPFVFGGRPTLADIGLFGPLFRHFSQDPDPAAILRERAPAVNEWVARLWNTRGSRPGGELEEGVPGDLLPLLAEICQTHLPNLAANAAGWQAGRETFDVTLQGTRYVDIPISRYRVWCLEQLQSGCSALERDAGEAVRRLLEAQGGWDALWRIADPRSGHDPDRSAPFGSGLTVYDLQRG